MIAQQNDWLKSVSPPPIAQAHSWLRPAEEFPDKPLLDLAQAVPSYPPAASLRAYVAEIAHEPAVSFYTQVLGLPELREALGADLASHYRGRIGSEQVAITSGCNQAFCAILSVLARAGDEVIIPSPYYFNHHMWLSMHGVEPVLLPSGADDGMPLIEELERLIGPRTRAIVLVTPNNPTGATYPPDFIERAFEIADRRDVALVIDETYRHFVRGDSAPHRLFEREQWDRTLVSLHSFSKSYSLSGYRVGAVVAADWLLGEMQKFIDCAAICPSHLSQQAALYALRHLAAWRDEKSAAMNQRVEALRQAFRTNELRYELTSTGAFFGYVRHPFADLKAAQVAQSLAETQNLLCLPGTIFGRDQERFLRVSFANVAPTRFGELVERLIASQDVLRDS